MREGYNLKKGVDLADCQTRTHWSEPMSIEMLKIKFSDVIQISGNCEI